MILNGMVNKMKVLVTGATGFLGEKLTLRLLKQGYQVTITGRNPIKGSALEKQGAQFHAADLADEKRIPALCKGQEIVFHCGALSSPWGKYDDFYGSNVLGTRHVIKGCIQHRVKRLVHVSTPSLYFQLKDQLNHKENDPLPRKKVNHYAETKWQAEQEVDRAWQTQQLETVTIRPRAIFGPGDQAIIPRLLRLHDRGPLPLINNGQALIDITYVENVVDALLLSSEAPQHALGKKYNITNGDPLRLIDMLELLFSQLEQPLITRNIPYSVASLIAGLYEMFYRLFRLQKEPPLTRYTVGVIGCSQTLDISAAKRDLGYQPRISIPQGVEEFVHWWKTKKS